MLTGPGKRVPAPHHQAIFRRLGAVLVLALCVQANTSHASGDAAMGARLFLQCRACHAVVAGAPANIGPNLHGVVGAPAGKRPGYAYSPALARSGLTWTPDVLDRWLTEPTTLVPGTRMAFAGITTAKARQDLIAYLATLDAAGSGKP